MSLEAELQSVTFGEVELVVAKLVGSGVLTHCALFEERLWELAEGELPGLGNLPAAVGHHIRSLPASEQQSFSHGIDFAILVLGGLIDVRATGHATLPSQPTPSAG